MKNISTTVLLLISMMLGKSAAAQTEVSFYTNYGNFVIELYDSLMPITAGNFMDLVQQEYYDGVIFHRVIDNFVIQGGDPTGLGNGGPGYTIPDEFDSTLSNIKQTISMANAGPNTGGSQFFINLVNNTHLDYDNSPFTSAHPIFGIVTEGFEIVDSIGDVPVNFNDRPLDSVVMDSLRIVLPPDTSNPDTSVNTTLETIGSDFTFDIGPNPNKGQYQVTISNALEQGLLAVTDLLGREVIQQSIAKGPYQQISIDMTKYGVGTYLVKAKFGNTEILRRVVVQ